MRENKDLYSTINDYKKYLINSKKLNLVEYFLLNNNYTDDSELISNIKVLKNLLESGCFEDISNTLNLEYLLYIAIYVNELSRKGIFEKFSDSLNFYLLKLSEKFVLSFNVKNEEFLFFLFPVIGKVIGYLSEFELNLDVLINFIIENIKPRIIDDKRIVGFYIRTIDEDFNKQFPNGMFPMGMAHGSLGVLFAISKLYKNNKLNSDIYVNYLYNLYEIFSKKEDNFLIFPNFVTYEEYKNKNFKTNIKQYRAAWCSGNLITSFILFKVCQNMNWKEKEKIYYKYVIEILCQNVKDYKLEIPIICHGYSFPLIMINNILKENYFNIRSSYKCRELIDRRKELNNILFDILTVNDIPYVIENKFRNNYSIFHGITGVISTLENNDNYLERILNIH
ncbi:lanthionine synthetase LanC family protein [Peptoniphilus harei]|uniref:Lanthionine synthetase C-like protein n=1 Tax=Peptoniphilus harei TaxID=54005 RepID=A0A943SP46_9FIRM|nr:lanthionine synthetase LanC family protein [Peptoniphilus harei]MBS6535738.1 hypothetical protein [Peptoniphilus harei]